MRLILHYLKNYKKLVFLNIISVFGFALAELGIPTIVAQMIDHGVNAGDPGYIWRQGGVIAVISVAGVLGTVLLGYCCAKISSAVTADIRDDVFDKAQHFSHREFNRFGVSSMITRTNNDAFQIQLFLNILLRTALMTPVMLVISFAMTVRSSVELSLVIASTIPIIILGVVFVAKKSKPISENQQKSLDLINRISRENLNGIRVVRAFHNDRYEEERFEKGNHSYTTYSKRLFKLMTMTQPTFFFLMNLAALGIFWVASVMIGAGQLQVGKLVAFMDYLFHAMFSMMLFCTVFMMYPKAEVSANRIREILNTQPDITAEPGAKPLGNNIESVVFDHVTFVYPGGEEAVLRDISFQVKKGETIAFIGSTGSGKSTLVSLLPRFYDVSAGSIRINGKDIRNFDLYSLRDAIGFIPQKAMLFSGTIADNIRFGREAASMEEITAAAKIAQAYDFITEKPAGFDEPVAENAANLSGGQKQRLSIARALVRKPEIYVFDDSFSALDFKTDAKLRDALKPVTKDAIVMVVAQRVSSIMDADQIVVLNEGEVAGIGTHRDLLKNCPIYQEIAASQLSEKELSI